MDLSSLVPLGADSIRARAVALFDANGVQLSGFDSSRPANAAITTLPATATSQTLLAANPARRQVFLTNEAPKTLYVAFAAAAAVASYTVPVASGATVTLPLNGYTGVLSAILASGTGNVRVTEVTT